MKKLIYEIINHLEQLTDEQLASAHEAIFKLYRYSQDHGEVATCPYCSGRTGKNGTQCGRQRHKCINCRKTFTCTVNTVMYRSKAGKGIWNEVISDTLRFIAIDETAERLRLSHERVFHMRHKVLVALKLWKRIALHSYPP